MLPFEERLTQEDLRVAALRSDGARKDPGGEVFAGQFGDDGMVPAAMLVGQLHGFVNLEP
jgi:hypothetical protein